MEMTFRIIEFLADGAVAIGIFGFFVEHPIAGALLVAAALAIGAATRHYGRV